jgi:predicted small lipoprotein YifL
MQTVKATLVILISLILLGACGLKGPLYLPSESPVSESAVGQESDSKTDETTIEEDEKEKKSP